MTVLPQFVELSGEGSLFHKIANTLQQSGTPAYLIGGYVRDLLLGRPCKDIDITVLGDGIEAAHQVAAALEIREQVHVFKTFRSFERPP
jgi:tRNA nucleotidyltransferase/poly(A) polymerase